MIQPTPGESRLKYQAALDITQNGGAWSPKIGQLLQEAGLITPSQIEVALYDQHNFSLPVGTILVLRGWIQQETVDFFVEQWPKLLSHAERYPLGQYLEKAGLLSPQQIDAILAEQAESGFRFGTIAVLKGWLKKQTVDYVAN
ncbi:MAG: hypothetical protein ACK58N_12345 [Synechocystis sp.]|jgi:hypothetical protein